VRASFCHVDERILNGEFTALSAAGAYGAAIGMQGPGDRGMDYIGTAIAIAIFTLVTSLWLNSPVASAQAFHSSLGSEFAAR